MSEPIQIAETADLLDAPNLFTQVYCEARVLREWPHDAAMDAARDAVKLCGDSPCKTVDELNSVTAEVLRVDGEPA